MEKFMLGFKAKYKNSKIKKSTMVWSAVYAILLLFIGINGLFYKPLQTAYNLTWAIGLMLLVLGIGSAIGSFEFKSREVKNWWFILVQGILISILGVYLMTSPLLETAILIYIYGIVLIVHAISQLITDRSHWPASVLKLILGILVVSYTGWFFLWAYISIFTIFVIEGIILFIFSIKALRNFDEFKAMIEAE